MTRSEVRHLAANRTAIISGRCQLIVNNTEIDPLLRAKVDAIDREVRRYFDDLMALFQERDETLGAVEKQRVGE